MQFKDSIKIIRENKTLSSFPTHTMERSNLSKHHNIIRMSLPLKTLRKGDWVTTFIPHRVVYFDYSFDNGISRRLHLFTSRISTTIIS